jgi:anti-anti-sigma factor
MSAYKNADELLVKCMGWLRLHNCEMVKTRIQALSQEGIAKIYLHIGELNEVDSAGLGVIVGLHMTARKNKNDFQVVAPSAGQMRLLETTRLTSILHILSGIEAESVRQRLEKPEFSIALPDDAEA